MNIQLTNLVEQAVLDQMRAQAGFTALDISNRLKADRYPVQHRDVAAVVRDIYQSGAMAHYDYERKLIPVVTDGGAKQAQAFLYHFTETRPRTYQTRSQDALPPVPADQARDLADSAAATALPILSRSAPSSPRKSGGKRRSRRDGALAVPSEILRQLGWPDGLCLSLSGEAGQIVIEASHAGEKPLKIWSGQRLRICRTKLRLGALTAERVTVEVEGSALKVTAQ